VKYDYVYEVTDSRHVEPNRRLGVIATLVPVPDGMDLISINRQGLRVDDSFGFDDDHRNGIVALSTADGRVTLTELTLDRYTEIVEPFLRGQVRGLPEFHSEKEMQSTLLHFLLED
jgi:hypothetical protein